MTSLSEGTLGDTLQAVHVLYTNSDALRSETGNGIGNPSLMASHEIRVARRKLKSSLALLFEAQVEAA